MTSVRNIEPLLNPRSIAFLGASARSTLIRGMHERLKRDGFGGPIWMVNPRHREILGAPCFPSLAVLPGTPDLVIVAVNAAATPQAVLDAADVGAKAVLVVATGFADSGAEGRVHAQRLIEAVARSGILLCGPGSFGFAQPSRGISPFSGGPAGALAAGNVGLIAQSGGFANLISIAAGERGFGFSFVVASGSEVALGAADFLHHMVEDPRTGVLVAVMEEIRDVPRFRAALDRAAALGKPVIVLPLGRSAAGQRATSAHSGALATHADLQDAFLRRSGAIVVSTLDDLIETVVLLSAWGASVPTEAKPLVTTVSGGDCSLVLDLAEDIGLSLPELGLGTQAALHHLLPESTMVLNPIDLGTRPMTEMELGPRVVAAGAGDDGINMVLNRLPATVRDFPLMAEASAASGKPQASFTRAALNLLPEFLEVAQRTRTPILQGIDRALGAVKRATDYAAWRASAPAAHGETLAPALTVTPDRFAGRLSEIEALAMLRTAGVPTVDYRRAATPQQALVEAAALGFPLAVKVDSPDIEHKTEIGGVRLDIGTPEALERAVEAILGNARKARPDADIRGVVLQPMMRPPLELIFGLVSDARFGAGVLVGLGGLLAEMLGRREVMLAPVTVNEAERAIARLFGGRTTGGVNFRGLDIGAAATALARFSVFATAAAPFVEAIDVNPVAVFRDGGGAVALDCLILPRRAEAP